MSVESWQEQLEKKNLFYCQLTYEMLCTPESWAQWFQQTGYTGDHSFICFE